MRTSIVIGIARKPISQIAIHAEVMEIVIALESAVVLANPVNFLGHEGLDDRSRDFRVVIAAQRVADIVTEPLHLLATKPSRTEARERASTLLESVGLWPSSGRKRKSPPNAEHVLAHQG